MVHATARGVIPTSFDTVRRRGLPYAPHKLSLETTANQQMSLRPLQSGVRNQGQGEYCVSFAVAACCEYVIKNGLGAPPVDNIHLSEAHITYAAENRQGDCTPGMELWQAMETVSYYSVVAAEVWPYDEKITCTPSPPDRANAIWYQVRNWSLFHLVEHDEIRSAMERYATGRLPIRVSHAASLLRDRLLVKRAPVLIDIPVTFGNGWDEPTDGTIVMPSPVQISNWLKAADADIGTPPGTRGWHAICVTGFDDTEQRFEFKNSWGIKWGKQGYGTLPYDYVSAFNRQMWDSFNGFYRAQVGPFPGSI